MWRRAIWALVVVVCLAAPVAVRAQGDYLDVYIVKVKPEKLADFQALTKKFVDANRKHKGDQWIASETVYGEGNVYQFTSSRKDYADIDKAYEAEMDAVNKSLGKELAEKMGRDFQNCLVWSRSELRRRRWDLSSKAPTDAAAYAKFIGESRVLRTTAVHIRPGHVLSMAAAVAGIRAAPSELGTIVVGPGFAGAGPGHHAGPAEAAQTPRQSGARDCRPCLEGNQRGKRKERKHAATLCFSSRRRNEGRDLLRLVLAHFPGRLRQESHPPRHLGRGRLQKIPAHECRGGGASRIDAPPVLTRTQQSTGRGCVSISRFLASESNDRLGRKVQTRSRQDRRNETSSGETTGCGEEAIAVLLGDTQRS